MLSRCLTAEGAVSLVFFVDKIHLTLPFLLHLLVVFDLFPLVLQCSSHLFVNAEHVAKGLQDRALHFGQSVAQRVGRLQPGIHFEEHGLDPRLQVNLNLATADVRVSMLV